MIWLAQTTLIGLVTAAIGLSHAMTPAPQVTACVPMHPLPEAGMVAQAIALPRPWTGMLFLHSHENTGHLAATRSWVKAQHRGANSPTLAAVTDALGQSQELAEARITFQKSTLQIFSTQGCVHVRVQVRLSR